jgi:hypothetical protein
VFCRVVAQMSICRMAGGLIEHILGECRLNMLCGRGADVRSLGSNSLLARHEAMPDGVIGCQGSCVPSQSLSQGLDGEDRIAPGYIFDARIVTQRSGDRCSVFCCPLCKAAINANRRK